MTFREAIEHAARIGIAAEETTDRDSVTLTLSNGEKLVFTSNYEEDYSEVTPGRGIEPPSVTLKRKSPPNHYRGDLDKLVRMVTHNVTFADGNVARLLSITHDRESADLQWCGPHWAYDTYRWEDGVRLRGPDRPE